MPRTAASDLASKLAGKEVRRAREAAGFTQAALAQRLETSPSYIANLEAGRLNLTLGQLARIAGALGADLQIGMPPLAVTATAVHEPAPKS